MHSGGTVITVTGKEVREAAASFRMKTGVAWDGPRTPVDVFYDADGDVADIHYPEEWSERQIFAILSIARKKFDS